MNEYLDFFLSFNPARLFFWSYANSVNSKTLYEYPLSFSGLKVACSQVRSTWFGSHRSNPRWQGFMIRDWLPNNLLLQWLEALGRSHHAQRQFSRILSLISILRIYINWAVFNDGKESWSAIDCRTIYCSSDLKLSEDHTNHNMSFHEFWVLHF